MVAIAHTPQATARLIDVAPDAYHALDSFSASTAKTVTAKSPLHAKAERDAGGKAPTKAMDTGTICHTLILGKGARFKVFDFKDWRTNDAKDAKVAARSSGHVPILRHDYEEAKAIAAAVLAQLAGRDIVLDGVSEQAMEWTEDSLHGLVKCRGMMDHLKIDKGLILDLKLTENASPSAVERTAENMGYGIQRAAYVRGVERVRPDLAGRVRFVFIFAEPEPPYAMSLYEGDGTFRELGERRWLRAVETWGKCLATNVWPGYPAGINQLAAPAWALAREDYQL